jgi:hypothetical protein
MVSAPTAAPGPSSNGPQPSSNGPQPSSGPQPPSAAAFEGPRRTDGDDAAREDAAHRREFRERLEDLRHFLTTMGKLFELMLVFGRDGLDELARSMGGTRTMGDTRAMSDARKMGGAGSACTERAAQPARSTPPPRTRKARAKAGGP